MLVDNGKQNKLEVVKEISVARTRLGRDELSF